MDKKRIWELDFLRGLALILMIYFHVIFDLNEFYNIPIRYSTGINNYIGDFAAILFITISGISCSFSRNNFKRGLKLLIIAVFLSVVTHIYSGDTGIKFGILHFLSVCMILYPAFVKLNRYILMLIGVFVILTGFFISDIDFPMNYLFPLGLTDSNFYSADYYPLIPWSGVFLFGISLSKLLYQGKNSLIKADFPNTFVNRMGKHSLIIYLTHQPIIMSLLYVVSLIIRK